MPSPGQFVPFGSTELKAMNINTPVYTAQPNIKLDGTGVASPPVYGR